MTAGLCVLAAGPASAGRSIKEPKAVKQAAKRLKKAEQQAALKEVGLEKTCSRSMLKTKEIQGVRCRLALHQAASKKHAPTTVAGIEARLEAAKQALSAAETVHGYAPLLRKPGLARHKFEAHKQACATVLDAYDDIKALPNTVADAVLKAKARALTGAGDAFNVYTAACECTKSSLSLAGPARASQEENGALQGILTSRGCLVNREKLKSSRSGPSGFSSGKANAIAKQNSDANVLLDYAKARDIGLDRCRSKYISTGGQVDKVGKLERCVCEEVKRWRFPKKRGRDDITLQLPVSGKLVSAQLIVTGNGKVKECGPLSGTAIP